MSQTRSHFMPDVVRVKAGQRVTWRLVNFESTMNAMHGFVLAGHNVSLTLEPGKMEEFTFVAERPGVYPYYCPTSVQHCTSR
jgi:nitrous-oxide reductase